MANFTVDNTMTDLVYEMSEREIYNDIRSEIGIVGSETEIIDATYAWKSWDLFFTVNADSGIMQYFTAETTPVEWTLQGKGAQTLWGDYYADYKVELFDTDDSLTKAVYLENSGTKTCQIHFILKYKYEITEETTIDIPTYSTLKVRASDETSIDKYGRRVLNKSWPEGVERVVMEGQIASDLARYKDDYARLVLIMKGDTTARLAIIYGAEISDTMTVTCDKLGLTATTYFIDGITIKDNLATIPVAVFDLVAQRAEESAGFFVLGTSELGGTHILA